MCSESLSATAKRVRSTPTFAPFTSGARPSAPVLAQHGSRMCAIAAGALGTVATAAHVCANALCAMRVQLCTSSRTRGLEVYWDRLMDTCAWIADCRPGASCATFGSAALAVNGAERRSYAGDTHPRL